MSRTLWLLSLCAAVVCGGCIGQARSAAEASACHKNINKLSMGLSKYRGKNGLVLRFGADSWKTEIAPYVDDPKVFSCPISGEPYSFNKDVAGADLLAVESASRTVLFYEGKDQKLDFRHGGEALVVCLDGRPRIVSERSARMLVWKPIIMAPR